MQHRQLSLLETTRFGLPPGGRWYRTEQAVAEQHTRRPGFLLTWDTPNRGKLFGIYQDLTVDEFTRTLNRVPQERRHGYQLLLHTEPCPGYMLLRWAGPPDPAHTVIRQALEQLRAKCLRTFRYTLGSHDVPEIVAYCSSCPPRGAKGGTPVLHSYHVMVKNLIFSSNYDGCMRDFFDLGMPQIRADVYTPNYQLLLPNSRAYGSSATLTKLVLD
jgi:hypothetical protein